MIAINGWAIWKEKTQELKLVKQLYIIQLLLNWSWTPIFFTYHLKGLALICIFLMIPIVAFIIFKTYKTLKMVALLLTPYLLWLSFAAYLNLYIWLDIV